jgi:anti-sigma factor RsiW
MELLPWYVNGTLSDVEHAGVDRHIRNCLPCRIALQEQYQLEALLKQQPTVPLSAEPAFDRLLHEIDTARRRVTPFPSAWGRLAAVTALAAGLAIVAWLATIGGDATREAAFVTATQPSSESVELDIVFAEGVSEAELRAIVREIGGVMTGGPSSLGRYRVRIGVDEQTSRGVEDVLERLRNDARVRLAARALSAEDEQ